MLVKNNRLKLLAIFLAFFACTFFNKVINSYGVYRSNLSTTISLSILDPSTNYTVTLYLNDGTNNFRQEYRTYGQEFGNVTNPVRENYNFLGWYDGTGEDANQIYSDEIITGPVSYYAKWQKIVCKKVTDENKLHKETCASGGCRVSAINIPVNSDITYGTTYGLNSPVAGDAYDCDVNDDGIYDAQTAYGKYTERFYFLRFVDNGNDERTGALVYYTSIDSNGPVDSQHNSSIESVNYNSALAFLPTDSSWDNPLLVDFDSGNGKVTRFLNFADLSEVCGPISSDEGPAYFAACGKWFIFENSRFQSTSLGRAGIWLEPYNNHYYRIQTQSVGVQVPNDGANSSNTARPVIEIPASAFEGFKNVEKHLISFETHGGVPQIESRRVYTGDSIGTIGTVTKEHHTFDGWYANYSNGVYSTPVNSSTIVENDMTLHAKWIALPTSTVTFDANGGTINGESTYDLIVDTGTTIDSNDYPTAVYLEHSFIGWYTDQELTEPFDETEPITGDITLYASWEFGNYVALVNGIGYDTLEDAIDAVPEGSVKTRVTILKDITLSDTLSIPSNKWVELDGGNRTISGSLASLISNSGKLDIISGTITTPTMTTTSTLIVNESGATLNVSGGTLLNPSNNGTLEFLTISNISGGTVNITGGRLETYGQSASINIKGKSTLNVSGGEIIAHSVTKGQAIYTENGTVRISGSAYLENVSGTGESRACVDNNGGTIIITGGTIVSKGHSAVNARKKDGVVTIGIDDNSIDITTPVLRGQRYGLEKNNNGAIINVYDGIFESYSQVQAISTTSVNKPDGINFKTDGTIEIDGVSYHTAYLLPPNFTINFYEESNGTPIPVVVNSGTAIGNSLPTPTPKQGYYFAGWYINGDLLQPVTSETVVNGPFNAYAIWFQSVSNATMDNAMSIQINSSEQIVFEETDIEPVTYASSDTTVATVDSDGTVHAISVGTATITITGSISEDTRTVTVSVIQIMRTVNFYDSDYDPNDLENSTLLQTVQVVSGSSIGANMPNPTNANYVISAWFIDGNSTTPFTSETTVSSDLIVVANWKEKVTYANLSTSPTPFELIVGNSGQIILSAINQGEEVEEYTLTSNDTDVVTIGSNNSIVAEGVGTTDVIVTGNLSHNTRSVSVTVNPIKYTVTFMDGSVVIKTVEVVSGSTVGSEMPPNQSKENYIFNGWLFEDNNNLTPFTSATQIYGNVEVNASWKEKISIATLPNSPLSIIVGTTQQIILTPAIANELLEDYTLSSSNTNYVLK